MISFRPKKHVVVCLFTAIGVFVLCLLWLPTPTQVNAKDSDLTLVLIEYPALSDTALDSCFLCHTSDTGPHPPLNAYGEDYLDAGRDQAAFGLIEAVDSDNDSFINRIEITALSFPGDPASTPPPLPEFDLYLPLVLVQ